MRGLLAILLIVLMVTCVDCRTCQDIFGTIRARLTASRDICRSFSARKVIFHTRAVVPPTSNKRLCCVVRGNAQITGSDTVTTVCSSSRRKHVGRRVRRLSRRVTSLHSVRTSNSSNQVALSMLGRRLSGTLFAVVTDISGNMFSSVRRHGSSLLSLLDGQHLMANSAISFSGGVTRLRGRGGTLRTDCGRTGSIVSTPVTNCFTSGASKCRGVMSVSRLSNVAMRTLRRRLALRPSMITRATKGVINNCR